MGLLLEAGKDVWNTLSPCHWNTSMQANFGNPVLQNNGFTRENKCSLSLKTVSHESLLASVSHIYSWQNFMLTALEILQLIPGHLFHLCMNCHLRGMQATCLLRNCEIFEDMFSKCGFLTPTLLLIISGVLWSKRELGVKDSIYFMRKGTCKLLWCW